MRDENEPIGKLDSIRSAAQIEHAAKLILMDEPEILLIVADTGEAFALDPDGLRAGATLRQRPEWVIGRFNPRYGKGNITKDLQAHRRMMVENV